MRELPMLFSTPMVQSIQDLRKTMTRRLNNLEEINQEPDKWRFIGLQINSKGNLVAEFYGGNGHARSVKCPWKPGDRLYVRETWNENPAHDLNENYEGLPPKEQFAVYKASSPDFSGGWRPSIYMPKSAARIWLEVTNIRAERVQDITIADILAEGVTADVDEEPPEFDDSVYLWMQYQILWESTIPKKSRPMYGWNASPWVWVIEFKKVTK